MNRIRNNEAITLIALVITIIIMLILVAVIISMAVNGGLFGYARNASVDTKVAKEKEQEWANIEEGMSTEYLMAKYVLGANSEHVARIGETLYTSIQAAVDAVETNNAQPTEIVLLKSVSESFTVPANKKILLNLDNNQITNNEDNPIITLNGFMQVKNGKISGTYGLDVPTVLVNPDAEIRFSNTNVSRNSEDDFFRETIELHGTLKIDSGKIENTNSCAIWSYTDSDVVIEISGTAELYSSSTDYVTLYNNATGKCTITGGKIEALNSNAIRQEGEMEVSGNPEIVADNSVAIATLAGGKTTIKSGTINSMHVTIYTAANGNTTIMGGTHNSINKFTVQNYGYTKITGGKFSSKKNTIQQRGGTMEIEGTPEIISNGDGKPTLYTYEGSKTTITGGTFISENANAVYNNGTMNIGGTAKIRGLKVHCPAFSNHGVAIIDGGTLYSAYSYGIWNYGTLTIRGGSFTAERSAALVNESEAIATITGGTFTGNTSIKNLGTCTVSGATLNGATSGID